MTKPKRDPRSPYAKYQKAPYRYSDTYQNWHKVVLVSDFEEARELAEKHATQFGYVLGRVVEVPDFD